jgi:hypothetical protein
MSVRLPRWDPEVRRGFATARRHDGEDSQMRFARLFRIQRGDGRRVALVVGVMFRRQRGAHDRRERQPPRLIDARNAHVRML